MLDLDSNDNIFSIIFLSTTWIFSLHQFHQIQRLSSSGQLPKKGQTQWQKPSKRRKLQTKVIDSFFKYYDDSTESWKSEHTFKFAIDTMVVDENVAASNDNTRVRFLSHSRDTSDGEQWYLGYEVIQIITGNWEIPKNRVLPREAVHVIEDTIVTSTETQVQMQEHPIRQRPKRTTTSKDEHHAWTDN